MSTLGPLLQTGRLGGPAQRQEQHGHQQDQPQGREEALEPDQGMGADGASDRRREVPGHRIGVARNDPVGFGRGRRVESARAQVQAILTTVVRGRDHPALAHGAGFVTRGPPWESPPPGAPPPGRGRVGP
ncbi:hypothetical protein GCM10027289_23520 [Tsukamurella serpentis]